MELRGTTICAVKRNGQIAVAGDGQVTMGENTIFKTSARTVRRSGISVRATSQPMGAAKRQQMTLELVARISVVVSGSVQMQK